MKHRSPNSFENEVHAMPAPPTEEQVARARRAVSGMAIDKKDEQLLLSMLGIS